MWPLLTSTILSRQHDGSPDFGLSHLCLLTVPLVRHPSEKIALFRFLESFLVSISVRCKQASLEEQSCGESHGKKAILHKKSFRNFRKSLLFVGTGISSSALTTLGNVLCFFWKVIAFTAASPSLIGCHPDLDLWATVRRSCSVWCQPLQEFCRGFWRAERSYGPHSSSGKILYFHQVFPQKNALCCIDQIILKYFVLTNIALLSFSLIPFQVTCCISGLWLQEEFYVKAFLETATHYAAAKYDK